MEVGSATKDGSLHFRIQGKVSPAHGKARPRPRSEGMHPGYNPSGGRISDRTLQEGTGPDMEGSWRDSDLESPGRGHG